MSKRKIMVVSGNPSADIAALWSNSPLFETTFVASQEESIELATQQVFDAVVVDSADAAIDNKKLLAILPLLQPDVALLPYHGGQAVELQASLVAAFRQKRAERMARFLLLNAAISAGGNSLPVFSAN